MIYTEILSSNPFLHIIALEGNFRIMIPLSIAYCDPEKLWENTVTE
jgi:hypothetical protein